MSTMKFNPFNKNQPRVRAGASAPNTLARNRQQGSAPRLKHFRRIAIARPRPLMNRRPKAFVAKEKEEEEEEEEEEEGWEMGDDGEIFELEM